MCVCVWRFVPLLCAGPVGIASRLACRSQSPGIVRDISHDKLLSNHATIDVVRSVRLPVKYIVNS